MLEMAQQLTAFVLARGSWFGSQHSHSGSQPSLTLGPRESMPSDFKGSQKHIEKKNTHTSEITYQTKKGKVPTNSV